jgi:hypothetical protein
MVLTLKQNNRLAASNYRGVTANATKQPHNGSAIIRQLDDQVVALVLTKSQAALLARMCAASSGTDECRQTVPNTNDFSGTQRAGYLKRGGLARMENNVYDIHNDQALPSLQTATNKKGAHRYRTVRLRQTCLAGVVA